jgi:hypothetical protein
MYDLIFTVVTLFPGLTATVTETTLARYSTQGECEQMRQQVAHKLVVDPPMTPTYLDCKPAKSNKK